jgi:hypothetical protein
MPSAEGTDVTFAVRTSGRSLSPSACGWNFCSIMYPCDQFLPVGWNRPSGVRSSPPPLFIFSHVSTCIFLSFPPPSTSHIFLRTRPKILKTCSTNQKARSIMAFGYSTETSSVYAQDKLNLTKAGYYVFYVTADALMMHSSLATCI